MRRLRISVAECSYKEVDRQLKEQLVHGLNDNDMITEIIYKLTAMEDMSIVTSEQVLPWAGGVESWRSQTVVLDS